MDDFISHLPKVKSVTSLEYDVFASEIQVANKPLIIKGLVKGWPLVQAAEESREALFNFLSEYQLDGRIKILEGPASIQGAFSYNDSLSGFNFERKETQFSKFVARLLKYSEQHISPVLSMQSAYIDEYFPGLEEVTKTNLLEGRPRIWIGSKTTVATHYDDAENIACVVSGKRRFTLFPPEQIKNLYVGPLEFTPAGAQVSLASLVDPDFEQYPKLELACKHALVADMEPGDALYIPSLWWHHVEALEKINVLVNFWQGGSIGGDVGPYPMDALLMNLLTIRSLPEQRREAWKAIFDHYIFEVNGDPLEHLPDHMHGMLGGLTPQAQEQLKAWISRQLENK